MCEFDAAIEACRQQLSGTTTDYNLNNGQSECSGQTSTEDGPVFEEFFPMKKRAAPACDDEEEDDDDGDEQHSHKKKSDWLRSVQLWNPNPSTTKEVKRNEKIEVELN